MKKIFNYIVPIFNKEDILPETLKGIERCSSKDSKIILVVDGCTDRSEQIVDEFIARNVRKTVKLIMPNVHMLLSVNEGLKHIEEGFSIIMQDDIILQDVEMEQKIISLYERIGPKLGVISFRFGSNIKVTNFFQSLRTSFKKMIIEDDFIKSKDDYGNYPKGEYDTFYPRMSAINGPNCIPFSVICKLKEFDTNLAPYGFDDPEFCLRALELGFINGLFPVKYQSDEEWGGTRRSKSFLAEVKRIHIRNRKYVYNKHKDFLDTFLKENKIYTSNETL